MNPETRAVDEQMDRLIVHGCTKWNLAEFFEPPGQSGMVGDGKLHLQHAGHGTKGTLGLPERKVEDHAEGECCLNRYLRVDALAAGLSAGWLPPGVDCIF